MFVVDEEGRLVVLAKTPADVLWRGLPGGRRVSRFATATSGVCVVLLEEDPRARGDANLVAVDQRGQILWTASPPDPAGGDRFVEMRVEGDHVLAHSWSGYRLALDVHTGVVMERAFTK